MTGVGCVLAAIGASSNTQFVTVGTGGAGDYGYKQGSYGSVTPGPVLIFGNALLTASWGVFIGFPVGTYVYETEIQGDQTGVSWTSITINGVTIPKSSCTISYAAPVTGIQFQSGFNLFGTTLGVQIQVVFT